MLLVKKKKNKRILKMAVWLFECWTLVWRISLIHESIELFSNAIGHSKHWVHRSTKSQE